MLTQTVSRLSRIASSTRSAARSRNFTRPALYVALIVATFGLVQQAPAAPTDAKSFFKSIVGDWIGTCQQSTDGKQAENKYFHASIKQASPTSYTSNFEYYRLDTATGKPVQIGTTSVVTTIGANGVAESKYTGKGTILVDYKPKEQKHDLKEVLSVSGNGLKGQGSGSLSVSGMPLGLGKNGKVKSATSTWTLDNDVLNIRQDIQAGFKALFFSKNFKVSASYSATRGTDVASLISKQMQASRPASGAAGKRR